VESTTTANSTSHTRDTTTTSSPVNIFFEEINLFYFTLKPLLSSITNSSINSSNAWTSNNNI
jgi:hypothetical protein